MSNPSSLPLPHRHRARRAFTLVEILVVLAIIGMLIGVLVKNTDKIFGSSQTSVARIFVTETVKLGLTQYRIDTGSLPTTAEGLSALVAAPSAKADRWKGPYLEVPGGNQPTDPWGEPYQYRFPGTKNKNGADIFSKGPDKAADTEDDVGNW
jgi:general secretion pathway protein G